VGGTKILAKFFFWFEKNPEMLKNE
jgi:hypothetical protein